MIIVNNPERYTRQYKILYNVLGLKSLSCPGIMRTCIYFGKHYLNRNVCVVR